YIIPTAHPHCDGYDLRLMSVTGNDDLVTEGRSLVIVALVSNAPHIRIFNLIGNKVIDKSKEELTKENC
ncbi:MAG: hypothetical protein KDN22_07940, partial [Verrucomicrobiae bacterium]|nr:hypothetical protein [Verrucomicrobiae bacterium]